MRAHDGDMFDDETDRENTMITSSADRRIILGRVAVDTGRLLIVDPAYLRDDDDLEARIERFDPETHGIELVVSGIAGTGVLSTTGLGDGVYEVEALVGEVPGWGERVKQLTITFIDDDEAAGSDPLPINVYTNAPAAYDYESTVLRTVGVRGHTRFKDMNSQSPFRLVALDAREDGYYAEYQQNRYKSGGYLVLTPETWDQWRDDGTIIIPDEKDAAS